MNQSKQKQTQVVTKSCLKKLTKKSGRRSQTKKEKWAWAEESRKSKAVESEQEAGIEREEVEFEHMVERENDCIYHQKNHPQKKKT